MDNTQTLFTDSCAISYGMTFKETISPSGDVTISMPEMSPVWRQPNTGDNDWHASVGVAYPSPGPKEARFTIAIQQHPGQRPTVQFSSGHGDGTTTPPQPYDWKAVSHTWPKAVDMSTKPYTIGFSFTGTVAQDDRPSDPSSGEPIHDWFGNCVTTNQDKY